MIMGYIKVVLLSLAAMSNILPHKEIKIAKPSQKSLTLEVKVNKGELAKRNKIKGFIKLVNPKYSESYIAKIVEAMFIYGKKYKVDPYIIASTAYVESEFSMKSKPCIGMMQVLKSTARYIDPKRQYNPYTVYGNIALGTKELSMHLRHTVRRGSTMTEPQVQVEILDICGESTMVLEPKVDIQVKFWKFFKQFAWMILII